MSARARLTTVATLLAVGVAVGHATAGPAPRPPAPQQVPVQEVVRACPDVRQEGERGATTVTPAGAPVTAAGPPGRLSGVDLDPKLSGAYVVRGGPGLVVEQTTRATTGSRRGVASVSCPEPTTSAWFVGGSTVLGGFAELVLVNAGPVPAVVDVQVWTSQGPADPRPGRGIPVPANARAVVALDRLAPDRDLLALHVRAASGQVAPALRVVRSDGRTPLGTDWVPPTLPPASDLLVPGLPQGPGRRTALLTNPGADDTTATAELVTADGVVPLDPVDVPAGTSVAVDLSEALAGTVGALRVTADVPLLAGASVVDRQDGALREISFTAAAPALDGPALLADVRLSAPTEVFLLLTAPREDAVVEVVPVPAPGALPEAQRVPVPGGTTVAVRLSRFLPPGSAGSLTLELRAEGRVHAARYSRERGDRGPLTTLLPVTPRRLTVLRPVVVADPGAGR